MANSKTCFFVYLNCYCLSLPLKLNKSIPLSIIILSVSPYIIFNYFLITTYSAIPKAYLPSSVILEANVKF